MIIEFVILIIVMFIVYRITCKERFNIPLRESSAFDWNLGPGYGAGYGTGYAMVGVWPASLSKEPWKWWMWGRRPLIFKTPFTPVPQIDYNDAPDSDSLPESNYTITAIGGKLAVNGFRRKTLQLDRNRNYFFHIYTPGHPFIITDGNKLQTKPVEEGMVQLNFNETDPDVLYYTTPNDPHSGGSIYLNNTRWE